MQLESENSIEKGELGTICKIENESIVEIVLDMLAACDDDDIVPIVKLKEFLETRLVDQRVGNFLAVIAPGRLFANETSTPPFAAFVINEPGDAGENVLVANFVLITAHHPFVANLAVGDMF